VKKVLRGRLRSHFAIPLDVCQSPLGRQRLWRRSAGPPYCRLRGETYTVHRDGVRGNFVLPANKVGGGRSPRRARHQTVPARNGLPGAHHFGGSSAAEYHYFQSGSCAVTSAQRGAACPPEHSWRGYIFAAGICRNGSARARLNVCGRYIMRDPPLAEALQIGEQACPVGPAASAPTLILRAT
jgi:hypothetical protein